MTIVSLTGILGSWYDVNEESLYTCSGPFDYNTARFVIITVGSLVAVAGVLANLLLIYIFWMRLDAKQLGTKCLTIGALSVYGIRYLAIS